MHQYFIPRIGHVRLRDLSPHDVETALRSIQADRQMKPATLRRVHASLRSALGAAVKSRLIPTNPAASIDLPSVPRPGGPRPAAERTASSTSTRTPSAC